MDADYASITKFRNEGRTVQEIEDLCGVSRSRIYQLLKTGRKRCAIHHTTGHPGCYRCRKKDEMSRVLARLERDGVMAEIRELSVRDRRRKVVARRELLIKRLHDVYGISLAQIGVLLNRDHTSVLNLYHKE
jgi:hypothetical protein